MSRLSIVLASVLAVGAAAVWGGWYWLVRHSPTTEVHGSPTPFRDLAPEAGISFRTRFLSTEQGKKFKVNLYDHGSGVAIADFDGDGKDDIYFVNQLGPNALYRNNGDGTFTDVTGKAGVAVGDRICTAATFADYKNEGRQSLFVTSTRGGNILFHNNDDGTFTDVTKEAGLEHVGHCVGGYFFDFDGDGYLDLLVLQTAGWTTDTRDDKLNYYFGKNKIFETATSPHEYNRLYRNNGNGTFTDVTEKSGLKGKGWSSDVAILDYDGDGKLDVLIVCMFGRSQLYRNNGDGRFTDVTLDVLGKTPAGGLGARVFDFDNDGKLDLYIVDMHSDMWLSQEADPRRTDEKRRWDTFMGPNFEPDNPGSIASEAKLRDALGIKPDEVVYGNTFHRNLGKGQFEEISQRANLETFWPWGIATGDFDNDGFEDVFEPAGMGSPWGYWPNRLLMNTGKGTFVERSMELGVEPPRGGTEIDEPAWDGKMVRSSRSAAVADFEGKGRLDLVVNNFNDRPYLFRNHFPTKNYIAFRLQGTKSNRDAIGAVVRVKAGGMTLTRQVNSAGGYLAQSSRTLHFGLGPHTKIDGVEVTWPNGVRQEVPAPVVNARNDVKETTAN
jgi:hypothetical protein